MSVQQIDGVKPGTKDWAFFIEFDWESPYGYIKSELQKCEVSAEYLPKTSIHMQVYVDKNNCCKDIKDYNACSKTCMLTPLDHHWTKEPLAFKMTATGTQFKWQVSDFVLDGTQFTSPTKRNKLSIGKDVNDGDVTKAKEGGTGTSLIEVSDQNSLLSGSDLNVELFNTIKQNLQGACFDVGNANEMFKDMKVVDGNIQFSCEESPVLCQCLTKSAGETKEVIFTSEAAKLVLKGDGDYISYFIEHESLPEVKTATARRRRLLTGTTVRGSGGGC
jgi:hypothetical protein